MVKISKYCNVVILSFRLFKQNHVIRRLSPFEKGLW